MFNLMRECEEQLAYAVSVRRALHERPELSEQEHVTLNRIREELDRAGVAFVEIENGGILASIGEGERTVLLRADCDALPMQESDRNAKKRKASVSGVAGVAHTCGHDAHTAMLLAAGRVLKSHENELNGRVLLLFERAEETGTCISNVIRYLDEEEIRVDTCMANHVTADLPVGTVRIPSGLTNAGSFRFDITLKGTGGHGSTPSNVNNPIDCFLAVAQAAKDLRMRCVSPFEPATVHICSVNTGGAFNITPETLTFSGSFRYFFPETGRVLARKLRDVIEHNAAIFGVEAKFDVYAEMYQPVYSDPDASDRLKNAVADTLGRDHVVPGKPAMGSESFGALTQRFSGVKCSIGIRNEEEGIVYPTHSPYFDLDENGIVYGAYLYATYAFSFFNSLLCP